MIVLHDSINNPKYRSLYRKYGIDVTKYHPRQSLVGKNLLAQLLHVPLATVIKGKLFIYGRFGKPYLKSHAFSFNLTDSKAAVILAADQRSIAVDTEKLRPFDYRRIHRAFSQPELHFLAQAPHNQQSRLTLKLWTIKEGVLKQVGTGLNGGLLTVHVNLPRLNIAKRKGRRYRLIPYNVTPAYVGTIIKDY